MNKRVTSGRAAASLIAAAVITNVLLASIVFAESGASPTGHFSRDSVNKGFFDEQQEATKSKASTPTASTTAPKANKDSWVVENAATLEKPPADNSARVPTRITPEQIEALKRGELPQQVQKAMERSKQSIEELNRAEKKAAKTPASRESRRFGSTPQKTAPAPAAEKGSPIRSAEEIRMQLDTLRQTVTESMKRGPVAVEQKTAAQESTSPDAAQESSASLAPLDKLKPPPAIPIVHVMVRGASLSDVESVAKQLIDAESKQLVIPGLLYVTAIDELHNYAELKRLKDATELTEKDVERIIGSNPEKNFARLQREIKRKQVLAQRSLAQLSEDDLSEKLDRQLAKLKFEPSGSTQGRVMAGKLGATLSPTWIIETGGKSHVFPGKYPLRSLFDRRGNFSPPINSRTDAPVIKKKGALSLRKSAVLYPTYGGEPLYPKKSGRGGNLAMIYSFEGKPRYARWDKDGSLLLPYVPPCRGDYIQRYEVFQDAPALHSFNVVFYDGNDYQQRSKSSRYPGKTLGYRFGKALKQSEINKNPLYAFAPHAGLECLPTRFHVVKHGDQRFLEYRSGAFAWSK